MSWGKKDSHGKTLDNGSGGNQGDFLEKATVKHRPVMAGQHQNFHTIPSFR